MLPWFLNLFSYHLTCRALAATPYSVNAARMEKDTAAPLDEPATPATPLPVAGGRRRRGFFGCSGLGLR